MKDYNNDFDCVSVNSCFFFQITNSSLERKFIDFIAAENNNYFSESVKVCANLMYKMIDTAAEYAHDNNIEISLSPIIINLYSFAHGTRRIQLIIDHNLKIIDFIDVTKKSTKLFFCNLSSSLRNASTKVLA